MIVNFIDYVLSLGEDIKVKVNFYIKGLVVSQSAFPCGPYMVPTLAGNWAHLGLLIRAA